MPEGHGPAHAALAHVQSLTAAKLEIPVTHVHVAVADPAVLEPEQHLGAAGPRGLALRLRKRVAPFDNVIAQHVAFNDGGSAARFAP